LIDLIGKTDLREINQSVKYCLEHKLKPMNSSYSIKFIKEKGPVASEDLIAIHAKIKLNNFLISSV
jgi:hypothetical protein